MNRVLAYWPQILLGLVVLLVILDGIVFSGGGNPDCPGMPLERGC